MKLAYHKTSAPGALGPPLVFLHGAGGSSRLFGNQFQAFRDSHTCYFVDLPGHGDSLHPIEEPSIELYAEASVEFINMLRSPAVLIGHSMGGAVALSVALSDPDLLHGLVLAGTACQLAVSDKILTGLDTNYEATLDLILRYCFSKTVDPGLYSRASIEIRRTDPSILRADFRACNAFNVCQQVREIRLPTLIICGAEDRMTPVTQSQQLRAGIVDSDLELIPGGSHMLMLEDPTAFNNALKNRLSKWGWR